MNIDFDKQTKALTSKVKQDRTIINLEGSHEQDEASIDETAIELEGSQEQEICEHNEVKHDDHSVDIEFPSDISKDYHPLVGDEKYNLQRVDHLDDTQNTRTWLYQLDNNEEVSYCDIIKQLRFSQAVSFKLEPKSLSDLRLLALNHICLFTPNIKESITSYLPEALQKVTNRVIQSHIIWFPAIM
ncbi:hypothetical protein RMCBS344292_05420 [Rhizopus microsporus]|nr:hypothetical protein RMCBS344292_05420 [Rhizopus microsporus]